MREIKDITEEELLDLANLASAGYSKSPTATNLREVECGGYGKRRRVEWTDSQMGKLHHYFEVSSEYGNNWEFSAGCGAGCPIVYRMAILCNIALIVDYCRTCGLNIDKKREPVFTD